MNISGFNVIGVTGDEKAGVYLSGRQHCNISDNTASNNRYGIYLHTSSNNTLANNTVNSNNPVGIYLHVSSNNTLANNTAESNDCGIDLLSSRNNTIYNNYFNNANNACDDGNNIRNTTPTTGTNIFGGSWLGGDYWSDYAGADTNGDDYHPLVTPGSVAPTPSGGGEGTYPPGWFGTPTPTVTATKAPAPSATATATAAPPGERVTPRPTKAKPAAAKAAAPAAEGTTAGTAKKGAPGFTAIFAIAGMLAAVYAVMRRRG